MHVFGSDNGDGSRASAVRPSRRHSTTTQNVTTADHTAVQAASVDVAIAPDGMTDEEFARFLQLQEAALADRGADSTAIRHTQADLRDTAPSTSQPVPQSSSMVVMSSSETRGTSAPRSQAHPAPEVLIDTNNDAALAASLQQLEVIRASRHAEATSPSGTEVTIEDPVWGRFESPPGGKPLRPHTLLCIAMCPCCVRPCSARGKQAWKRAARSASFILAYIQILLWLATLIPRGFAPVSINPMLGPFPDTLDTFQAKNSAFIVYDKHLWRLVIPIFLHAGLIHLVTNLGMQMRLGIALEYEWGVTRYLCIYFACGIMASVYSATLKPAQLSVGASGALMGVFGAWVSYLVSCWGEGDETTQKQRSFNFIMAIINIGIIVGFSFVPFVDWAAHIFGLLGGVLLGVWFFVVRDGINGAAVTHSNYRNNNAQRAGRTHRTVPTMAGPWKVSRKWLAYGSLAAFLLMLFSGFMGLYFNTEPPIWLLQYCETFRISEPQYGITC